MNHKTISCLNWSWKYVIFGKLEFKEESKNKQAESGSIFFCVTARFRGYASFLL